MPADESRRPIFETLAANLSARFSSVQHDFAGHRVQSFSGIFSDTSSCRGHRHKPAGKSHQHARFDYRLHTLFAAG